LISARRFPPACDARDRGDSQWECVFEADQFDELNELLADRLPLMKYSELLSQVLPETRELTARSAQIAHG
jgi:hypothetical protein